MKLEQKAKFQPIVITLETEEDAAAFWDLIRWGGSKRPTRLKELATKISDWFSNSAQLGGFSPVPLERRVRTAMPIRPENKARYPADWKLRSRFVRHYRARNRCEWCGAENGKPRIQ